MTKIEKYAFGSSKLTSLIVENCKIIEEKAFVDINMGVYAYMKHRV